MYAGLFLAFNSKTVDFFFKWGTSICKSSNIFLSQHVVLIMEAAELRCLSRIHVGKCNRTFPSNEVLIDYTEIPPQAPTISERRVFLSCSYFTFLKGLFNVLFIYLETSGCYFYIFSNLLHDINLLRSKICCTLIFHLNTFPAPNFTSISPHLSILH